MKTKLVSFACFAALAALSASPALAGEVTGNGKETPAPDRAASECAFSGRDDGDAEDPFTHTQSYGQLVRMFGPMGGVPGTACNPTRSG